MAKIVSSRLKRTVPLAVAGIALAVIPANAADSLYKGKQIKMVVASGAGGGYDAYARLLASYLEKKIPGNPTFVTQNMPGASGINATNWAASVAPRDGSVILATANAVILEPLYGNKAARYDSRELNWVGSTGKQQQICFVWHDSPIKSIDDVKTKEVRVSATGAAGGPAYWPLIINQMVGTKFKVIGGYSTPEMRLAVERREVDGICGLAFSTLKASSPDWISGNKLRVLMQMGTKVQKGLENVPLLYERASAEDKKTLKVIFVQDEMGRPYAMPPGTPKENVAIIRSAFDNTMKDPQFLAEAAKRNMEVDPLSGAEMEALIKEAYATPKATVDKAAAFVGRGPFAKKKK
jgi:tripartite-type tricarboxylate transporter receptor subunit TctC